MKRTLVSRTYIIRRFLLYLLPPCIFLAYYPHIVIGSHETMNLELSVLMIWMLCFFIVSIPTLVARLREFFSSKTCLLTLIFPVIVALSVLWSANPLRAVLTTGMLWLIYIDAWLIIAFFLERPRESRRIISDVMLSFVIFAFLAALYCWIQCILDVAGVSRFATGLCGSCTYQVFGFPHPNGLSVEPQFMGNLLLAPTFICLYLAFCPLRHTIKVFARRLLWIVLSIFFTATLFLTLSRGAIYAFGVGYLVLIVLMVFVKHEKRFFFSIPIVAGAVVFTVLIQGLFAQLSPTNDTFFTGVAKYVDQLSLGIIELRDIFPEKTETSVVVQDAEEEVSGNESFQDGYVEFSTDVRTTLAHFSLNLWHQTPTNFFFGVGIGGAGVALYEAYPDGFSLPAEEITSPTAYLLFTTPKQIVQNEYVDILLETGLIGALAALIILILLVKYLLGRPHSPVIIALVVSYLVSFFFLSGLPNVLHIYFLPIILMLYLDQYPPKHDIIKP